MVLKFFAKLRWGKGEFLRKCPKEWKKISKEFVELRSCFATEENLTPRHEDTKKISKEFVELRSWLRDGEIRALFERTYEVTMTNGNPKGQRSAVN